MFLDIDVCDFLRLWMLCFGHVYNTPLLRSLRLPVSLGVAYSAKVDIQS